MVKIGTNVPFLGQSPVHLDEILIFTKVVQAGSFTAAGRELGMPKSTASRKISQLEERLGARLLHRTTRKLSLTDAGRAYYQHATHVAAALEEAEQAVARLQETPRGLLRVTAPMNLDYLSPMLRSFLKRYPEVRIELVCTDRVIDLVDEGFDVAIRIGRLPSSSLVGRNMGTIRSFVVATPTFLKKNGTPKTPRDLEHLDCIVFGGARAGSTWQLEAATQTSVVVRARYTVNDFDFLHEAVLAGLGLALLPTYRCVADLRARRLRRVLRNWSSPAVPIHAVYPSTRHLSPKVKAFLDHLSQSVAARPWR